MAQFVAKYRALMDRRKAQREREAKCSHVWDDSKPTHYECLRCQKWVMKRDAKK